MLTTAPFALFHFWNFIVPGLYHQERRHLSVMIFISLSLFCAGLAFCFYGVLPCMFQFFAEAVPTKVVWMPDMSNALAFISHMLLLFGLCFQVPLICLTLVQIQWVDILTLQKIRPYVIVAAFIIGMLFTPPDVVSQIMLALPICVLYELGIVLTRCFNVAKRLKVQ